MELLKRNICALSVALIASACTEGLQQNTTEGAAPSVDPRVFASLGAAAGDACVAAITKRGDAEALMTKAGFSKGKAVRKSQSYRKAMPGGGKSFGGKEMGRVSVGLPIVEEQPRRKTCSVIVGSHSYEIGNTVLRAFQSSVKKTPIGSTARISGSYRHGTSIISLTY